MFPGVAKIPDPMIREMVSMYADVQVRFRPKVAVSGKVSCSTERSTSAEVGGLGDSSSKLSASSRYFAVLVSKARAVFETE